MAVSKTTRFQVLKRDGHACQYCGAKAPDAKLTVDHVIPVALGGSDKPDNLVAACRDCNAGKGASNPDNALVQRLSAEAATYALEMANKAVMIKEQIIAEESFADEFDSIWGRWTFTDTGEKVPLPDNYRNTIVRWFKQGIPMELIEYAVAVAMRGRVDEVFRYMCGVVYRRLEDADVSYTLGEPKIELHTNAELVEAYEKGAAKGYQDGAHDWAGQDLHEYKRTDPVARHIDMRLAPQAYTPFDYQCRRWDPAAAARVGVPVG